MVGMSRNGMLKAGFRRLLGLVLMLSAFAAQAQTTQIVASGFWTGTTYVPSCNYTIQWTLNVTYANGVYSNTQNTSNSRTSNCQNKGPTTCTQTGFYAAAQDLLTASQWMDMRNAFHKACDYGNVIQSVTFNSPDSISTKLIQFDGRVANSQGTRTATSYTLTVSDTGTGYGSVTSSPAGISCYVPVPGNAYLVAPDCTESYAGGTKVTLTASPSNGSSFAGWSGACTGTGTCIVTMDAAKSVAAVFKTAPFVAATSKIVTATSATITATISFNAPDVGKSGAVYVTGWVPVGALGALGISAVANSQKGVTSARDSLAGPGNAIRLDHGTLAELDASAFVLVQLTSSGWQLVSNGQLIPYTTGVLGDQLAALTILNNTATASLAGAQFCLGYGTSAAEMIAADRMLPVADIADPNATGTASGTCIVSNPAAGVWWNTAEGGRGYVIEQSGSSLFFGAFLYDSSGRSTWYAAAGAMNGNAFSASLTPYSGGQTLTGAYQPATAGASAGNVSISFADASHATLTWPGGTIPIQRFDVVPGGAAMTSPAGTPETGIWWNPAESGRGFALEIQGGTMFLGGYMFDGSGNPIWYSSGQTPMTDAKTYIGTWSQYGNGQTLTGTYNSPVIVNANAGAVRIDFSDTQNATLTLPDGRTIPITRFRF